LITLTFLLVDDNPVTANLHSFTVVALVWGHELDPAVAAPVLVPLHKRGGPLAAGLLGCE